MSISPTQNTSYAVKTAPEQSTTEEKAKEHPPASSTPRVTIVAQEALSNHSTRVRPRPPTPIPFPRGRYGLLR